MKSRYYKDSNDFTAGLRDAKRALAFIWSLVLWDHKKRC